MNCQMKPLFNPSRLNAPYSRNQFFDRAPSVYSKKKTNMLNTNRTIVIDQGVGTLSLLMYWRSASIAIESSRRVVFFQRAFQIFAPLSAVGGQVSVVPQGEFKSRRKSRSRRGNEAEVFFAQKSATSPRRLPCLNTPCVVPSTADRLFAVNHWTWCIRSIQRFQFLTHERHQRFHRSEEHTSELQSHSDLVCRLLLEKKKKNKIKNATKI